MNLYSLSLLFFSNCTFFIALIALLKRNDIVGKRFLVFSIFAAGWAGFEAITVSNVIEYETALLTARLLNLMALFIPPSWLSFVFAFLGVSERKEKMIPYLYIYSLVIACFSFTPLFVPTVKPIWHFNYFSTPGPIFHFFTAEFFLVTVYGFYELVRSLKVQTGMKKNQILALTIATLIGFIGGSLTFLPGYGISFPQYGLLIIPLYPFIMAYAVIRQGLLDSGEVLALHREKLMLTGLMTSSINHEIRNPLFLLQELSKKAISNLKGKVDMNLIKPLENMEVHINRMNDLVTRLREFGKPSTTNTNIELVNIVKVIDDALFFVQQELRYQNVDINIDVPNDLPPIHANKGQLEEVFLNLFMNALQAMPKGGVLSIILRTSNIVHREKGNRSTKYEVQCTITDTGIGMTKDELKHIFTPFYTKKEKEGTGLGLYIVKSLVEQNRGNIKVKSILNQGTTFQLLFNCNSRND